MLPFFTAISTHHFLIPTYAWDISQSALVHF
jgi:hypothetical protein